jgi:hypothetical protein
MKLLVIPMGIGVVTMAWLLAIPLPAQAHKVISTNVIQSSDTQAAFAVTFQLGFLNREARLSALAHHTNHSSSGLAYELIEPDGTVITNGRTEAIVLSESAPLRNTGEYHIPSRKNQTFTLLVAVDSEQPLPKNTALIIKGLPLTLVEPDGTLSRFAIPPVDLADYRTQP